MASVADQYKQLASNLFRGTNVSASIRKSPIELKDNSPTSSLNDDPFHFSSISYPRDVTSDMQNGHYMLFYVNVQNKTKYKMNPYGQEPGTKIGETVEYETYDMKGTNKTFISYGTEDASYRKGLIQKGAPGNVLSSDGVDLRKGRKAKSGIASVLPTTTRITDSIAIYLPPNVTDTTGASYSNEAEMGIVGMAAASGGDFVNALRRKDYAGAVKGLGSAAADLLSATALNLGAKVLGEVGELAMDVDAEDLKSLANKAFGRATNPYMEVLFNKAEMRTFDYNFTFTPRSEEETLDVQKIIKMFRFHMMPELRGSNSRFLTLPSTFDIHYMYQMTPSLARENQFYNKIATCVLTNCDVSYTPNGVKSFASGAPTQITMNLSFMETEQLTKQHVDQGF
jgi:hypothetical protein